MFRTMFYVKNVPIWERVLRVGFGVILAAVLIFSQVTPLIMIIGGVSILFMVVTGFIGWCPMCAMVGRKISAQPHRESSQLEIQKH